MPISKIKISSITADASSVNLNIDANTLYLDAANNRVGVGTTSPTTALDIAGTLRVDASSNIYGKTDNTSAVAVYGGGAYNSGAGIVLAGTSNVTPNTIMFTRGAFVESARIDANGNFGLGAVPSAWSAYKAFQMQAGSLLSYSTNDWRMVQNVVRTASTFNYLNNGFANSYLQDGSVGGHAWFVAPSGTAGNLITFNQAMTLDANSALNVDGGTGKGRLTFDTDSATNTISSTTTGFGSYNALTLATPSLALYTTGNIFGEIRRSGVQGSNGIRIQGNAAAGYPTDTNPGAYINIGGGTLTDTYEGNIDIVAYGTNNASDSNRNQIRFKNRTGVNTTTTQMRIGSTGAIFTPNQPVFAITSMVFNSGSAWTGGGQTANRGGWSYNSSTGAITVPTGVGGYFMIHAHMLYNQANTPQNAGQMILKINGAFVDEAFVSTGTNPLATVGFTHIRGLAGGDVITVTSAGGGWYSNATGNCITINFLG